MSATFAGMAGPPVLLSNVAGGKQVSRFGDRPWLWRKVGIRRQPPWEAKYRLFSRHRFRYSGRVKERRAGKSELKPKRALAQALASLGRLLAFNAGDGV
jgi:hypothetical protein